MKANLLDIKGKEKGKITLPKCFETTVRKDIIAKVIETKKIQQPYAPSPVAGNQSSASGNLVHRRHVWKSQYGRGMSRVPRKRMSQRGSQFNWVAAVVPNTRGGRRAHPPKVMSMVNTLKINKKELKLALMSAISATANAAMIVARYATLKNAKVTTAPFIVEDKITKLKTKELITSVEAILGKELFNLALQKKKVRSGKGTLRGRKYKSNQGLLLVVGDKESVKTTAFDVITAKSLGVNDLAQGAPGRITIYTESAIKHLGEKFK
jgi:large subunit ribosomal protein L4e